LKFKNKISEANFSSVFFYSLKLFKKLNTTAVKFRYLHVQLVLKKIFDFYIKSSIHVALAVLALAKISLYTAGIIQQEILLIFIFFSAVSAYNFVKFFPLLKGSPLRLSDALILGLTLGALLISGGVLFLLPWRVLVFAFLGGILVLGYTIPFHTSLSNWRNLRGWKLNWVVLSWLCLTVGAPLASVEGVDTLLFVKLAVLQGVYIYVAILPFEIGDLNSDATELQTLPQRYGIIRVKIWGGLLLLLASFFALLSFGYTSPMGSSSLLVFLLLGIFLGKSNPEQSPYFARFWVEGLPLLWCVLIYYF
jgi:hypothetical protein